MPIGNPRWLPPQVIVLTQDHMGNQSNRPEYKKKENWDIDLASVVKLLD
jgi:hypothetical protein